MKNTISLFWYIVGALGILAVIGSGAYIAAVDLMSHI